ncbi:MAG TPA: 3-deoxy-manno-octulosonate cytidylyltransferase [Desulfobacterales bacterium]|nr:3-deoxy-manno-octulosonate cytidylyltransferase [Desulfobacterales bacterium]
MDKGRSEALPEMNHIPKCYGIIPARYASTRFPGKPLAEILGKPMFRHVFERARRCPELSEVVMATDDERILSAAKEWGVPAVKTRDDHMSGTDRVLEAAIRLQLPENAIVVNIQGDEPALEPAMLTQLVRPFSAPDIQVTTLAREIDSETAENPDQVKVVFGTSGKALYFSRAPIPYHRDDAERKFYGHVGLYAFRMNVLRQFVALGPSRLETTEKLEQLRLLENDLSIHVVVTEYQSIGVDRPADIEAVSRILENQAGSRG